MSTQVEFVAVKNPKGVTVRTRNDGSTLIRIEMTQEELNATIDKAVREHCQKKNKAK